MYTRNKKEQQNKNQENQQQQNQKEQQNKNQENQQQQNQKEQQNKNQENQKRNKKVTSCEKSNVMEAGILWREKTELKRFL